jgi:streptogramin lyase
VLASIPVDRGAAPFAAVGGFGSVWVAVHRGIYLYRIDPATNTIQKRISNVDGQCLTPVAGAGRLWAAPCTPAVAAVDGGQGVFAVVNGIPWAYIVGGIESLDPRTYKVTRVIHVDANPRFVSNPDITAAYGDGAFWVIAVADDDLTFGGSVVKVDAKTGKVDQVFDPPEPGNLADIEFLDHAVWLKGNDSGALVRLDAVTGKMTTYVLPGFAPLTEYYAMPMAVAMGDLWIRLSSAWVSRFDPVTGKVIARYPADPNGNGGYAYVSNGSLWIANFATDTIWRDKIS